MKPCFWCRDKKADREVVYGGIVLCADAQWCMERRKARKK